MLVVDHVDEYDPVHHVDDESTMLLELMMLILVMFVFRILAFTLKLKILLKLKKELRPVKSTILTTPTEGLLVQNLNKRLFL